MLKLKRTLRLLLPQFVRKRREENRDASITLADQSHDLINKAANWWQDDQYTKVKRYIHVRWLGVTLFKIPYHETIEGSYFNPGRAKRIVSIIKEMQAEGLIPPLDETSQILEPGCNVGANLYFLQKEFKCGVVGMDLSREAVRLADRKFRRSQAESQFYVDNVLTTDYFRKTNDNAFDLVITRWHLIHVPRSDLKKKYVDSLKRISKAFVIFEPVREGYTEVQLCNDLTYTLSWDNWALEYGLQEYTSPTISSLLDASTKVYFWTRSTTIASNA